MSAETPVAAPPPRVEPAAAQASEGGVMSQRRGVVATVIIALLALVWLFPLLWALVNSFREYEYTQANGYLSFGGWTTANYEQAWSAGQLRPAPAELPARHRPGRAAHAVAVLDGRLRARAVQLPLQPRHARASSSPPTCCRRRRC